MHCSSILCTQVCLCRIDCELTQRAFTHIPSCCNHAMHTQDSTHTCADWDKSGVVHLCSLLMRTGGINSQKVSCRFVHINDEYKYDRRHGRDVTQTCGVHAAILQTRLHSHVILSPLRAGSLIPFEDCCAGVRHRTATGEHLWQYLKRCRADRCL